MLEYLYKNGEKPCEYNPLKVRLDGRIIGSIKKVNGGYRYFPKNHGVKWAGYIFPTVSEVQKSLACPD